MGTTKRVISRLECHSAHMPSTSTLLRYARAVGCDLQVRLVPHEQRSSPPAAERSIWDEIDWDDVEPG